MKAQRLAADQGDKDVRRQIAIINSMTQRNGAIPGIIDGSRRRRIAAGAGVQVQDVNRLHEAVHGNAEDDEELRGREAAAHDAGVQG